MTQAEVLLMKDDVILCFDICLVLEFFMQELKKMVLSARRKSKN